MSFFFLNGSPLKKFKFFFFCLILLLGCRDQSPRDIETVEGNPPVGPYLQNMNTSSVSVLWSSLDKAKGSVEVKDEEGNQIGVFDDDARVFHSVRITGLEPSKTYRYQVKEGSHQVGIESRFKTPPTQDTPNQSYTFAAFGDSGFGTANQYRVAQQLRLFNPDFVIIAGDIVYPNGAESLFDEFFFQPYQDLIIDRVFWTAIGNHDLELKGGEAYLKFFENPANNEEQSERYYSFEYGNAFFVSLDSNNITSAQEQFLETELAASQHTWRFVFFHHPAYSNAKRRQSRLSLRDRIGPIVEKYDVDIVFNGHDHNYERTSSLQDYVQDGHGTIYIVSGGGGRSLNSNGTSEFTEHSASVFHFLGIQIDENQLDLQAIDEKGRVFDELHLTKTP